MVTVSVGHPQPSHDADRDAAPKWFAAMDRNSDGDISRREFLGIAKEFDRFDRDRDGWIDLLEAKVGSVAAGDVGN